MSEPSKVAFLTVPGPCDLACVFCVSYRSPQPTRDPSADLLALREEIDRETASGVEEIIWGNGDYEPTNFPHLLEVLRHARDRGVRRQTLVTNGFRAGEPALFAELVEAGLTGVRLSLFGWDADSADLFCDAKGVLPAKQRLIRACRDRGLHFDLTVLLMRSNYRRVGEIVDLYSGLLPPGRSLSLLPIWSTQGEIGPLFLPPLSGLYQSVREAAEARPTVPLFLVNLPPCFLRGQPEPPPNLTLSQMGGMPDLSPCEDCPGGEICVGLPPRYHEVHPDRLDPGLAPYHAELELSAITEVLRDPPNDPFAAVAQVLGLPPPEPYVELDVRKLITDPSSSCYGLSLEAAEALLKEESEKKKGKAPEKTPSGDRPASVAARLLRGLFPRGK